MEEKVYFKNKEGLKLCGILTKSKKNTKKCIILCHGIAYGKEEGGIFTELAQRLAKTGFAVFRFDFRGHGESEGDSVDLTIRGEKKDLESALEFLKNLKYKKFSILAASFGGGAVSLFIGKNQNIIKALVLWNPIIDYHSILKPKLSWPKANFGEKAMQKLKKQGFIKVSKRNFKVGSAFFDELKKLHPWKELQKAKIPILFIHGDKDNYTPLEDSIKYSGLFKNADLEIIKGGEHGFHSSKEIAEKAYSKTIKFFLKNF